VIRSRRFTCGEGSRASPTRNFEDLCGIGQNIHLGDACEMGRDRIGRPHHPGLLCQDRPDLRLLQAPFLWR